jgi:DNA-binding CsgD family transcriptional regulator
MGPGTLLQAGLPAVGDLQSGEHVCALYSGPEERDRLLVPFLADGLRHGDDCVCLADVRPRAGEFSVDQGAAVLAETLRSSTDEASARLRAAADVPWRDAARADRLFAYESAVNEVLTELPVLFLCMYDVRRLAPSTIVDVLKMHSKVLLDGTVLDNPGCVDPADSPQPTPDTVPRYPLARLRAGDRHPCDQWLDLTGAEVRVAELVARGLTNRATAEELMVSPHTVDAHLKHMYAKLGIHSRVELTRLALQHGASVP